MSLKRFQAPLTGLRNRLSLASPGVNACARENCPPTEVRPYMPLNRFRVSDVFVTGNYSKTRFNDSTDQICYKKPRSESDGFALSARW